MSLLFAGGLLWLFLAAIPALADGGPHLTAINSGTSSLTADSCAGCHRAHTAQGEYLLVAASEEALCLSCHGTGNTGATTNVEYGIQYIPASDGLRPNLAAARNISNLTVGGLFTTTAAHGFVVGQTVTFAGTITGYPAGSYVIATVPSATTFTVTSGTPGTVQSWLSSWPTATAGTTGVILGSLRDGGFIEARIGASAPIRTQYIRGFDDAPYNLVYALSTRPKVGVDTSEAIKSAHIDLTPSAGDGIADQNTVWGKGALNSGAGTPNVSLTCVECHNPHGNGNYRILRPVPGVAADPLGSPVALGIKATYGNADTLVTASQHGLAAWDKVTIAGVTGLTDGTYYVQSLTNGFTFKISATLGGATITTIPDFSGAGATVVRPEVPIFDPSVDPNNNPLDGIENPTKNYTIIETKGSQGVDSTFLLYARDVIAARNGLGVAADQAAVTVSGVVAAGSSFSFQTGTTAHGLAVGDLITFPTGAWAAAGFTPASATTQYTVASVGSSGSIYNRFTIAGVTLGAADASTGSVVRKGIPGTYSATGGDYFRRTVPWNPKLVNPTCDLTVAPTTANAMSAYCSTMNDAPNGRPSAISAPSSGTGPASLYGQQAFLDQMSTWCSQCHTRYYQNTNENIAGDPPISTIANNPLTTSTSPNFSIASLAGTRYPGPSYGDRVTFSGTGNATLDNPLNEFIVIATGTGTFQVTLSTNGLGGSAFTWGADITAGTFTRTYQSSNSGWGYPREDSIFKYQHSTASNRACVVCHVGHGSNADMSGQNGTQFSLGVTYPGTTTTSTSSRLLKVDNRGTCQLCHDPTGTVAAGTTLGNLTYNLVP